ncbi:hypothetical protein EII34_07495 [Arachnia propionica]|uniref:Glycosyl hydrolase n=1 Tax=Arachnia propionica TaxID=1750 RepID=A0A3P1T707_9ACTN|nr:hypothetical protein [Arachnia propionica]RRD05174.1 hypothetical protein EII34_07495 [Arachnia propionica]
MKTILRTLAAVMAVALCLPAPAHASTESTAVRNAYLHLDEAMDEWGSGDQLRVPSSYHRGFLDFWDNSLTYDNALMIIVYANRKDSPDSLARARIMGDALLQMQANDPIGDGRLRNAYGPEHLFDAEGVPNIQTWGSAAGNQAWAGMALAHLAHVTGERKYLDGAVRIGEWLLDETGDIRGVGGFTGGYRSGGDKLEWKSTEHNIDMVGLFGMLGELTGEPRWSMARMRAETFVRSMWDVLEGRFHIGSTENGIATNVDEFNPEDVQSWGYMVRGRHRYLMALDWVMGNLEVTDPTYAEKMITGVLYAWQTNPDNADHNDDTVWLEGTAHMALALKLSGNPSHRAQAEVYLQTLREIQVNGINADGKGIQANSKEGYAGGEERNHASLHTGTTAWFIMAEQGLNPFVLAGTKK